MPLSRLDELLSGARDGGYAVGSFSVANLEMIEGAVRAAEEEHAPIILQIAESRLIHSPLHIIGPAMVAAAKAARVPVAVHFDHGLTIDAIKQALSIGFTSVMFDGSKYPFEKNAELTLAAKREAVKYGACIEAEIGRVGGNEDGTSSRMRCTDPNEAEQFYSETKPDALAVAIGNAHGFYKSEPKLEFEILSRIAGKVCVPLVLHGGSGISDDDFKKCIRLGIRKINVATATFEAVRSKIAGVISSDEPYDYFTLSDAAADAAYENVKRHIGIFGSGGKA